MSLKQIFWFLVRHGDSVVNEPFVKTKSGQYKPYEGGLSAAKAPKFDGKGSSYDKPGHLSNGMNSTTGHRDGDKP